MSGSFGAARCAWNFALGGVVEGVDVFEYLERMEETLTCEGVGFILFEGDSTAFTIGRFLGMEAFDMV